MLGNIAVVQNNIIFNWSELAFSSKAALRNIKAVFVPASREISNDRLFALVKELLPVGNVCFGIATENFVLGLENQPQFKLLQLDQLLEKVSAINSHNSQNKIYILSYSQRDLIHIINKRLFKKYLFVNGSWYGAFHRKPEYYALVHNQADFDFISPFNSESEAITYPKQIKFEPIDIHQSHGLSEIQTILSEVAKRSYDFAGYQVGAILAKKHKTKYKILTYAHNVVVPYETYAMHYRSIREKNFAPVNDLNYYDTIHAEVMLILGALNQNINLTGTSVFLNVLPCPTCAKMLSVTNIEAVIYNLNHSQGYAEDLFSRSGITLKHFSVKEE